MEEATGRGDTERAALRVRRDTSAAKVPLETPPHPELPSLEYQCTNISYAGAQPGLQHSYSSPEWTGVTQGEIGCMALGRGLEGQPPFSKAEFLSHLPTDAIFPELNILSQGISLGECTRPPPPGSQWSCPTKLMPCRGSC